MSGLINLRDADLFGNDAAEDEEEAVFRAYVLQRDEANTFRDAARRLAIVRAYKGEGKSALLRLTQSALVLAGVDLAIREPASTILPALESDDLARSIRDWKKALLGRLAAEVGQHIGFAWSDDSMALVEEAERGGFKPRFFLSSILERLKFGISIAGAEGAAKVAAELGANRLGTTNPQATVQRWLSKRDPVWLLIDDVDLNFQNTAAQKNRVSAFFIACRELVNSIPELRIRATIRPNVWTTIKLEYEPLSHVEQYMCDLSWSEEQQKKLLARRIEGYLQRRSLLAKVPKKDGDRDRNLIGLVFDDPVIWGRFNRERAPHIMLHTLSKHRPRWLVELSKVAALRASKRHVERIGRDDVIAELGEFGRRRIEDTNAEFRAQCPEVGELFGAFHGGKEEYSTAELVSLVRDRILSHLTPRLAGVVGPVREIEVARFLFEIGFFYGRRDNADGTYEHITFSDNPLLLQSRTALDAGLVWEVHPIFRQALEMRDGSGRERV